MMTLAPQLTLPFPYRTLDALGEALRRAGMPIAEFDDRVVHLAAVRRTGLSDFGDPYYRQGLLRLLDAAEHDANLHFVGRAVLQWWIVLHLANRLRLVEAHKHQPEVFAHPLTPPLIVLGLPRSGTTLLHRLLATDPTHRGTPMWELMRPIPPPAGRPDLRRQMAAFVFGLRGEFITLVDNKHYIRVDVPEECMWMLATTFVNLSFWVLAPVYGYLEWYTGHDLAGKKYEEYRWLLHILQAAHATCRLTLKAPEHAGQVNALLRAVPEAMVIQTHRDPVTSMNSFNSLLYSVHLTMAEHLDVHRMARANLDGIAHQARLNVAGRDQLDGKVHDVTYGQLVADPVGTVRAIYDHFGLAWPDGHEKRLQAYMEENPKGKHGRHHYRAADFGLTDDAIAERFRDYYRRFPIVH
jgi:hypothetical protein